MTEVNLEVLIENSLDPSMTREQKQRAQNRLLLYIQNSPMLYKASHIEYLDALDRAFEWLLRHLDEFKPRPNMSVEKSFFKWFNTTLGKRVLDLKEHRKNKTLCLDSMSNSAQNVSWIEQMSDSNSATPKLSGLDGHIEQLKKAKEIIIIDELEQYVDSDPEDKLKSLHPRSRRECNCQILSQEVLFKDPPEKFSTLSKKLDINYQTLKSHWEAKCKPCLQQIAHSLGYSPDF